MIFIIPRSWKGVLAYGVIGLFVTGYYVSSEYEKLQLNNFQTKQELNSYLYHDPTSNNLWSHSYTCDSFAEDLIANAKENNYYLEKAVVENPNALWPSKVRFWVGNEPHALCIAFIESENQWYYIEPQSDEILGVYKYYNEHSNPFREMAKWIMQIKNTYLSS